MVSNIFFFDTSSALSVLNAGGALNHFLANPPRPIAAAIVDVDGTEYGTTRSTDVDFCTSCFSRDGMDERMSTACPRVCACGFGES